MRTISARNVSVPRRKEAHELERERREEPSSPLNTSLLQPPQDLLVALRHNDLFNLRRVVKRDLPGLRVARWAGWGKSVGKGWADAARVQV